MAFTVGLHHFLIVSAILFGLGVLCLLTRRHVVRILMGIELILNAANVNLVAFSHYGGHLDGQVFAIFVIALAAAEAAVALALLLAIFQTLKSSDVDELATLKE